MAPRQVLVALGVAGAAASQIEANANPVQRVVGLLKEMQTTIEAEQAEDKAAHGKQKCMCNDGAWEKGNAKEASENKISELESAIKAGTARSAELNQQISDLNAQVASDTEGLNMAKATREKELQAFHGYELDAIQNVENMKAALTVMEKHDPNTFVQEGSAALSFLAMRAKEASWTETHDASHIGQSLEEFLRRDGVTSYTDTEQGALQPEVSHDSKDEAIMQKAKKTMRAFLQTHDATAEGVEGSGEILGVMRQLKSEMETDLKEAQEKEQAAIAAFDELRADKTQGIEDGEAMSEKKEDELATTDNDLAEAKEDLGQEQVALDETTTFLANLEKNCAKAEKNFDTRTQERADEGKAVSETIEILTSDEARDTMDLQLNFMQMTAGAHMKRSRAKAASTLRRAASEMGDTMLMVMASRVELDAFGKVKKSIDDMIGQLKIQQSDEVKKNDWCKAELQDNEMVTLKTEDHKGDLEAKVAKLESALEGGAKAIEEAKAQIAELQVDLQRSNELRKQENLDFQKVIADQILTAQILKKALDKLASHYDLVQTKAPNAGAGGVMQMIEKLIQDAGAMQADAIKAEGEAQAAYETAIADSNASIEGLQKEVTTKDKTEAKTTKHKLQVEADIKDTVKEIDGLTKYNGDLHEDCDYLVKNFDVRQGARAKETAALQQAKQILSGANM